eukprot:9433246-Alexandrium_andersonii.AAC.1
MYSCSRGHEGEDEDKAAPRPALVGRQSRQFKLRTLNIYCVWGQRWQMSIAHSLAVRPLAAARASCSPPALRIWPPPAAANPALPVGPGISGTGAMVRHA